MNEPEFDVKAAHKYFAPRLNVECWNLLDKDDRTEDENRRMLMAAFASCYHWIHTGSNVNQQRGEWLIARVYAALGDSESCLKHAQRCMEWTKQVDDQYQDFDFAYAHEMVARGYAMTGNQEEARKYHALAVELGNKISGEKDREIFLSDLAWGVWPGLDDSTTG